MTIIIADTTSGITLDQAKNLRIHLLPQQVIFGEESFKDDSEITTEEFIKRLKASSTLPKTSAPLHTMYLPIFEKAAQNGETVIVIVPSSKLSGTLRSVETARQEYPKADIRIIDTLTIAGPLGTLVLEAHAMASAGKSPDEIETYIQKLSKKAKLYFVVDTLEYLQKGGRIGAARALIGELLQVKPILQLLEGQAAPFVQERTKKRAISRMIDTACDDLGSNPDPKISVMHIDAEDEIMEVRAELSRRLGIREIPVYLLPPAIVVHAGPKALAIGYFK